MTLHIVHPHMYFLMGTMVTDDLSPELKERNAYAGAFIDAWTGERLTHWMGHEHPMNEMLERRVVESDPGLRGLLSLPYVKTTPRGMPVPEETPKGVREEVYERVKRIFSTEEQFQESAGSAPHVVIGGALEFCVANAAHYLHINFGNTYVVPEVSMVHDPTNLEAFLKRLDAVGVSALTATQARELL